METTVKDMLKAYAACLNGLWGKPPTLELVSYLHTTLELQQGEIERLRERVDGLTADKACPSPASGLNDPSFPQTTVANQHVPGTVYRPLGKPLGFGTGDGERMSGPVIVPSGKLDGGDSTPIGIGNEKYYFASPVVEGTAGKGTVQMLAEDICNCSGVVCKCHVSKTNTALRARIAELEGERDKLKAIIVTHDLCHDLHGKVNARDFADACAVEQRRLYGCAPDADAVATLRKDVAKHHGCGNEICGLKQRIRDAEEETNRERINYLGACGTIAKMHEAATGGISGPSKGVVEDVAALKADRDRLAAEVAWLKEEHDEMSSELAVLRLKCATPARTEGA